ncbi:outer membrane protein assembly factor BamB family protein [Allorhodopirellula solitaria]|uniref:Outer membrane biogenesis protein BamB n=1 Tax=Allorhodopirellula solitaria TaxID=2527987 RepID=A0A5C5YK29_9BACT|nr:PQQ-binding-like beta-propeller repeat protein [Allorhodopirellula solitaria]TWT75266.1 outer membrane biogenesis protein BamB [Allorhodopirellula solitaria]
MKKLEFTFLLTIAVTASVIGHRVEAQAVWPSFLGQGRTEALDVSSLPLTWGPDDGRRWKAKITGKGQSSPIVWGDTIYVTSIDGDMKETCIVTALDLKTGDEKWRKTFDSAMPLRANYFQSRSAPTPLADGQHLVAFFETGTLVGLDSTTGEVQWQRSLVKDYGPFESTIGLATSPVGLGEHAFLMIDHEGESYLLAIDKASGETVWRTPRFSRRSYASPAIIRIGDCDQIVCSSDGSVDGYDPETGEQLWTFEDIGANSSNTPLQAGENTVLIGASAGMQGANLRDAVESNLCLRIDPAGDGFEPHVCWKTQKATTTFASPMAHEGYAYWLTNVGVLYCYELETGTRVYRKRAGEQCWVTPVAVDDRVYLFGKGGTTTVIASGPEFKVLAENELWDLDSIPSTDPGAFSSQAQSRGRPGGSDIVSGGGRPPMSAEDLESARAGGENQFADPVQYGVAFTKDAILVRTGSEIHCLASGESP